MRINSGPMAAFSEYVMIHWPLVVVSVIVAALYVAAVYGAVIWARAREQSEILRYLPSIAVEEVERREARIGELEGALRESQRRLTQALVKIKLWRELHYRESQIFLDLDLEEPKRVRRA